MTIEIPKEKWIGKIGATTIGATEEDGGTRDRKLVLGGASTLPFLRFEGETPLPVIAMEVYDVVPEDYSDLTREAFKGVLDNPGEWAKRCVDEHGANMICLRLEGTNPEGEDRGPEDAASVVKEVLKSVGVPLMIYGSGHDTKDAKVMETCSNAAKGERCFLGLAEEDKYKSIAVASMANGHGVVAFSNLDINLAKQLNILLTDFGVKLGDIIMDPLMAGLGVGLEYSYSVIERIRIAALMGDKMLQVPILCDMSRAWAAREAHAPDENLGDATRRGPFWEVATALSAITAGADLLVMRHPKAVHLVKRTISGLGGE